jgi:hypothetical protein
LWYIEQTDREGRKAFSLGWPGVFCPSFFYKRCAKVARKLSITTIKLIAILIQTTKKSEYTYIKPLASAEQRVAAPSKHKQNTTQKFAKFLLIVTACENRKVIKKKRKTHKGRGGAGETRAQNGYRTENGVLRNSLGLGCLRR